MDKRRDGRKTHKGHERILELMLPAGRWRKRKRRN
jgi:hypothetical protein